MPTRLLLFILLLTPTLRAQSSATTPDIGAQINAQLATCPAQGCTIQLPPNRTYTLTTPIRIPAKEVRLDCNNSTLFIATPGDAIDIVSLNGDSPTGSIENCKLLQQPGNTAARNAIHQHSRIWFTYRNLTIANFTNPQSAAILLDNDAAQGWPGYNERTHFDALSFVNDTIGLRLLGSNGGTNSFGRTVFEGQFDMQKGQFGISLEGGPHGQADVYGGTWIIHGNLTGPGGRLLNLANAQFRNTLADLEGEGTGGFLYYADAASGLHLDGVAANSGGLQTFNAGASDQVSMPLSTSGFVLQGQPFQNGQLQANNPKLLWNGASLRLGLPRTYIYGSGFFQIFTRHTDTNPEIDSEAEASNPQVNKLYCSWSGTGCGFGPGFGPAPALGGTRQPLATVDVAGNILSDTGTQLPAATDLDTIHQCGVYNVSDPRNGPPAGPHGIYLEVLCGAAPGYSIQHVFDAFANNGFHWTRTQQANRWTPWIANGGQGLTTTLHLGPCTLTLTNGLITAQQSC